MDAQSTADQILIHTGTRAVLWLGGVNVAADLALQDANGVKSVVNCTGTLEPPSRLLQQPERRWLRFALNSWPQKGVRLQAPWDGVEPFFRELVRFVLVGLRMGHSVLIHCKAGRHRAATATSDGPGPPWLLAGR